MRTLFLYAVTAFAEILGCYLFYLVMRDGRSPWLGVPAIVSLLIFAWLLTLHPAASGRVYAAYGGVYVVASLLWLWGVDGVRPNGWDVAGGVLCLAGMAVIAMQPR
jgi:small multidrug resistance family-3 protein